MQAILLVAPGTFFNDGLMPYFTNNYVRLWTPSLLSLLSPCTHTHTRAPLEPAPRHRSSILVQRPDAWHLKQRAWGARARARARRRS